MHNIKRRGIPPPLRRSPSLYQGRLGIGFRPTFYCPVLPWFSDLTVKYRTGEEDRRSGSFFASLVKGRGTAAAVVGFPWRLLPAYLFDFLTIPY